MSIPGHMYGSSDQTFGMVERYASRIETVYTPNQWYQHVRNAGAGVKSVEVVEMEQVFRNFREHLRKLYTERSKNEDKKPLDFMKIVWFNFGKGEKEVGGKLLIEHRKVWVHCTYNVRESPRHVSFYKKRNIVDGWK